MGSAPMGAVKMGRPNSRPKSLKLVSGVALEQMVSMFTKIFCQAS